MAFLADARRRELLRQSGGTFQFRHIRLQEALAGQVDRRPGPSASGTVRRRVLLTAGAVATVTAATGVLRNWRDESRAVFTEPDGLGMTTVAFRPGSRHDIAVGSEGGRVWLWPGRTESSPFDLLGPGAFTGAGPALAFHPGGRFLAACWDDRIHQWDLLERPRLVERRRWAVQTDDYWLGGLMFRQGGSRLVGATADHLFMWRVLPAGRLDPLTDNGIAIGSAFRPDAMALLRDGSLVMLDDSTGQVWKYRSPEFTERTPVLMTHQNDTGLTGGWMTPGLTANPSGDLLAVFGPKDGELWCRAPDGRTWRRARGTFGRADKVRIHPRRPWLAAADPGGGEVHLWRFDASSFTLRRSRTLVGHSEEVLDLAFSPDGERLVTAGADGTVRLWDIG